MDDKSVKKNRIGDIIETVGYVIFAVSIVLSGYLYFIVDLPQGFNWRVDFGILILGFVVGMLFLGFGEIIMLLDSINNQISEK